MRPITIIAYVGTRINSDRQGFLPRFDFVQQFHVFVLKFGHVLKWVELFVSHDAMVEAVYREYPLNLFRCTGVVMVA